MAIKRKIPQKSCRHDAKNGGDLGVRIKKRRQESIGSVDISDVDSEDLENTAVEKNQGEKRKALRAKAQVRTVQVERERAPFVASDQRFS